MNGADKFKTILYEPVGNGRPRPVAADGNDATADLIMSFQKFYGLEAGQLHDSSLARIPEAMYRSPDVDRARSAARVSA